VDEQANVRVVEGMFSSLQRGDIAGVLDRLSDDIEWRIAGPSELPYAGIHRGRDEVARFFQTFGQAAEFEVFEPREYLAKGDKVVVLGHERQRIRASGQVVETDWAMVFALRDGRITRFRNYVDSRDASHADGGS
jgi:ketosteroid isomerase-like protein